MKKPYFNIQERQDIQTDTFIGAQLKLKIATLHLKRELYRQHGLKGLWILRKLMKINLIK